MRKAKKFNCLFTQSGENYRLFINDAIKQTDFFEESETSASYFAEKLAEIPEGATLEVHINSDGGDAFEATAIYNLLKQAPIHKIGIVDGHAFSAATFVLQACDERVMLTGTTLLVHNAWTIAMGNAEELRAVADDLDKLMESNRNIFLERSTMSEEELIALLREDRMLTPDEALAFGLIDKINLEAEPEPEEPEEPEEQPEDDVDEPEDGEETHAIRPDRIAAEKFFRQYF